MKDLLELVWKSTKINTPPLTDIECDEYLGKLGNEWKVTKNDVNKLEKSFKFPNFVRALEFINLVGEFSEEKNHHPDLSLTWGKAGVIIWTHRIKGLAIMDFVFAANIEKIYQDNFA